MEACFIWYLLFAVCCLPLVASSHRDCGKENFPCDTGNQCVKKDKWCDKEKDCRDGSDEAYCKKSGWWSGDDPNNCVEKETTHILCDSGICIPIAAKCDKQKDCDDGYDEYECEPTERQLNNVTSGPTKSPVSAKPSLREDNYISEDVTKITATPAPDTSFLTSTLTVSYEEYDEVITTSTTRDAYSSRINGYFPTSTSFYQKRMKEAGSETKPIPTFPKTIPTIAFVATRSIVPPTVKAYSRIPSSTTPQIIAERRPPVRDNQHRSLSTRPPSNNARQHQAVDQRSNHYQPVINHYQLPTHPRQSSPNQYQPPTYPHQPPSYPRQPPTYPHQLPIHPRQPLTYSHQPHIHPRQSPTYPQQPPTYPRQPPTDIYQSPTYPHQPPSNRYQPQTDYRQSPSYTNYNEHRPLNGEPDVRYQTNYFKPYSSVPDVKKFFYFAKDYASTYGRDNAGYVLEGIEWLQRQRSDTADWGRDTPRAVIALALANNNFSKSDNDYEFIKKRFMIQLGADLLRNNTENFNINRMAMAINGLLAVCEDPTDFHGMDLTEMLRYKIRDSNRKNSYLSPFVLLSLCLSNKSLSSSELQNLMKQMSNSANANERTKDMKSAAIMAFSCYIHQSASEDSNYRTSLRSALRDAVANLLEQIGDNGNFGSVYSTALAAQALMSTNESSNWDAAKTMSFLKQQQHEDGSFGDLLATYFVLPALSGRSLLHLRNIHCNPVKRELTPSEIIEFAGPKQSVHYSLYFGYPVVNTQSLYLLVPTGINFLDVMRVAEYQDQNFRFALEDNSFKVYSLSGLPNDPEMGLFWHLYVKHASNPYSHEPKSRERFNGDVRNLSPKPGDHVIFWYHSNELRI